MFMIVDFVKEMTVKKSCKYGEYGSFEHLLFLCRIVIKRKFNSERGVNVSWNVLEEIGLFSCVSVSWRKANLKKKFVRLCETTHLQYCSFSKDVFLVRNKQTNITEQK